MWQFCWGFYGSNIFPLNSTEKNAEKSVHLCSLWLSSRNPFILLSRPGNAPDSAPGDNAVIRTGEKPDSLMQDRIFDTYPICARTD